MAVLAVVTFENVAADVVETTLDDFLEGEDFDREDLRQRGDTMYADEDAYAEREYETKYQGQQKIDTEDAQQTQGKGKGAPVEPWMVWAAYVYIFSFSFVCN